MRNAKVTTWYRAQYKPVTPARSMYDLRQSDQFPKELSTASAS